jgi:hypothetical protein
MTDERNSRLDKDIEKKEAEKDWEDAIDLLESRIKWRNKVYDKHYKED